MSDPPMPSIDGMFSSMGPAVAGPGFAPSSSARRYANAASFTRNAMAQAEGPCCARERLRERIRLRVDDEVDVALPMQRDVLRAVTRHDRKPEPLEQRAQQVRIRRGVLDELESIRAHRDWSVRVVHDRPAN